MIKYYINKTAFPAAPDSDTVTHYVDCSTGEFYFYNGTDYIVWQNSAGGQYPIWGKETT